jgi:DNA polymerase-3 subunit delta
MTTTLTGLNSFALQTALQSFINDFIDEHGEFALERIDGEVVSMDRITEAVSSLSFLSPKKMIVLRTPSANKQFVELVEGFLSQISDTTELIIVEPKLDKRSSYYKFLKKSTEFREYYEPDSSGLAQWLVKLASQNKVLITVSEARYLVERVGGNQQMLSNEMAKLCLAASAENDSKPVISRGLIELMTETSPQSKIFDLLDAAFANSPKRALSLYADQRAQKVEPQVILAMLARQLQQVALMKTAGKRTVNEVAADSKLSVYPLQKSSAIAQRLTLLQLRKLIDDLLAIDVRSKREALDLDDALQQFILTINLMGVKNPVIFS